MKTYFWLWREFSIGLFCGVDWYGQPIWFYQFVARFCFSSASALPRIFLVGVFPQVAVSFIFLPPRRVMVVSPLLTFPIDCHATLLVKLI